MPMRVEGEESDAEKLKVRTGEGTVAAAIRNLAKEEKKDIYITYPRDGGTKTVTAGEMAIDLLEGKIKLPDGTIEVPSTSLKAHRFKWARSILFETNKDVVVRLEEKGGKWTIDAESWLPIVNQQFQKVYVTISEDTEIRFWASTHPEGVLRKIRGSFPEMQVHGTKLDTDGTSDYFETDQALGTTPTLYIPLTPSDIKNFVLESVRFYMNPTNAVTYQLYLLEDAQADNVTSYGNVVFDSGSGKAADTIYIAARGDKLPMLAKLATAGRLYYMIDWSSVPGNTPGFIEVRGRAMV